MLSFTSRLYLWLGVPAPFDPQHRYVTSYVLSPFYLFLWRAIVALFTLITCIYTAAHDGGSTFSYFTVLSYWGIMGYFVVSALHTGSFWWSLRLWQRSTAASSASTLEASASSDSEEKRQSQEPGDSLPYNDDAVVRGYPKSWLDRWPRPFQAAHALLVSTVATYPLIVTIVYWNLLGDGSSFSTPYSSYSNMSKHALNLFISQLDVIILGRAPMRPWWHLLLVVLMIAGYVGVAYITYAMQGFYTYDFLNQGEHGTGSVIIYVIGIGVGTVISFMIGQFLIFLRESVAARLQRSGAWGSARIAGVPDDACIATQRGPGPEGEGGKQNQDQNLRGRWPANHPHY
ncbi:hypothetical protein ACQY0O_004725 [Thecaphora frezii]